MKKIAMYRRTGNGDVNGGLKEKILWQLSNGPMTGQQLSEKLKVSRKILRGQLKSSSLKDESVAVIAAGPWFKDERGRPDRFYEVKRVPRRVTPRVTERQTIVLSKRSASQAGEKNRKKCIEAAQRRARLIAAGLWVSMNDN